MKSLLICRAVILLLLLAEAFVVDSTASLSSSVWTFSLTDQRLSEQLERCYQAWASIWSSRKRGADGPAFAESKVFFSSSFCHSYWLDGMPVGTLLLTEYDRNQSGLTRDLALLGWPPEVLSFLGRARIPRFGVLSHLGALAEFVESGELDTVLKALVDQSIVQAYRRANFDDLFALVESEQVSRIFQSRGGKPVLLNTSSNQVQPQVMHINLRHMSL